MTVNVPSSWAYRGLHIICKRRCNFQLRLRQSINQLDLHEPIEKGRQYDLDGIDEVETLKPYRNDGELVDAMVIHW